jgi:large subunit ribosomal protein L13
MAEYIIDGKGKILGRVGSGVAKRLLSGDSIVIVNAEDMLISGHPKYIVAKYKRLYELKDKANPEHSPYWSRRPDLFVKRIVRGMLPYKKAKGKEAYKRLKVYIGFPEELKKMKEFEITTKNAEEIYENTMTIKQIVTKLGYAG